MMMKLVNRIYTGSNGRQSLIDLEIPENFNGNLIVFVHGFMGFKDWGAWNLVQQFFTEREFGFCKFNLSHNGGTIENGIDFPDEKAFGGNCYSYEVQDIESALHWLIQQAKNIQGIHLIGHSRGGGDVILAASKYQCEFPIKTVHTWAGISDIGLRFPKEEELKKWKQEGVRFVMNGRTKQNLPQYFSLFEDYETHYESLNIESAVRTLNIPIYAYHGDKDASVSMKEGKDLAHWISRDLCVISGADHVFGARHPWGSEDLPEQLLQLCEQTLENI
jgi:pimeloyl-ACP methyl ester carboxylesterase